MKNEKRGIDETITTITGLIGVFLFSVIRVFEF
jgi:hypothetical protein